MRLLIALFLSHAAFAAEPGTLRFNYKNVDAEKVINDYALASGQKFVIGPTATHAKVTIINKNPVTFDEAFAQLSSALALDSVGISKQGDNLIVNSARGIQRDLIETGTELPKQSPERMFTWTLNLKYVSSEEVNKQLRILSSKDGELVTFTPRNQLIITDWVTNLYRIQKILASIDVEAKK